MSENNTSKLSKWLESLQQESWQLELIISGFAIFLVGSLGEPLDNLGNRVSVMVVGFNSNFYIMIPLIVMHGAWFFLLINLILHVVLRGLWISTIGLRYVSGDIDWASLKLHPRFDNFLQKKIGSYDEFIERLEKLCSVVFALTFLIIFILIAFGMWFVVIGAFMNLVIYELFKPILAAYPHKILGRIFIILSLSTSLVYFFDFLTLGWLKRKKWASKFYYPIYRFYSFITLANLYRPIYYNLIDHKYGRNLAKLIVPYIFITGFLMSLTIESHPYFPSRREDVNILDAQNYDDEREAMNHAVNSVSIPSRYVSNGFLELFILYQGNRHNRVIERTCPDLKPLRNIGLQSDFIAGFNDADSTEKISSDSALHCVQNLYQVTINDSLLTALNYRFFRKQKYGERGLKTIIDVDYLPRGEHFLKVDVQNIEEDSLFWKELAVVPFWKE